MKNKQIFLLMFIQCFLIRHQHAMNPFDFLPPLSEIPDVCQNYEAMVGTERLYNLNRPTTTTTTLSEPALNTSQTPLIPHLRTEELFPRIIPATNASLINMLIAHFACVFMITQHTTIFIEENQDNCLNDLLPHVSATLQKTYQAAQWKTNKLTTAEMLFLYSIDCIIKVIKQNAIETPLFYSCLHTLELLIQSLGYQEKSLIDFRIIALWTFAERNLYYKQYLEQQQKALLTILEIIHPIGLKPTAKTIKFSDYQDYSNLIGLLYNECYKNNLAALTQQFYISTISKRTLSLYSDVIHSSGKNKFLEACAQANSSCQDYCASQRSLTKTPFLAKTFSYLQQQVLSMTQQIPSEFVAPIVSSYRKAIDELIKDEPHYTPAVATQVSNMLVDALGQRLVYNFKTLIRSMLFKTVFSHYCQRVHLGVENTTLYDLINEAHALKTSAQPHEILPKLYATMNSNNKAITETKKSSQKKQRCEKKPAPTDNHTPPAKRQRKK